MIPSQTDRRHASRALARLWLVLLLVLTPLLTFAGGTPVSSADGDGGSVSLADQPMPCHEGDGQPLQQPACPHCAGDGTASQCHCCDFAAPAGLSRLAAGLTTPPQAGMLRRLPASDPLPDSPGDLLYRPPIIRA